MRIDFATRNSLTHTDSEPDQRGGEMARLDAAARFIPTLMFSLIAATGASVMNREQPTTAETTASVVSPDAVRHAAFVSALSESIIVLDKPSISQSVSYLNP